MKNILLVCNAGMSTSMLVQKMQAAAKEQGIEATIQAKSVTDAANEIDKADVLLLGPTCRWKNSSGSNRYERLWNNEREKSIGTCIRADWRVRYGRFRISLF